MIDRRRWLRLAAAATWAPMAALSLAAPGAQTQRFVFVLLRGGMDGLAAVPAVGDPSFAAARGPLAALPSPALPLDNTFALNPLLPELHQMYQSGELAVVHAVGLPYRERSHFDAQQVLESGGTKPYELSTGWLGRALASGGHSGVALSTAVPLLMRGSPQVDTWAPSALPEPSADLVTRLSAMYATDPAMLGALERARALHGAPGMNNAAMGGTGLPGRKATVDLARKAGEFLRPANGPRVAVLEIGGWDSHTNQSAAQGAMSNNLRTLDAALAAMRSTLVEAKVWSDTVVVVATEFGREVAANGTLGTDHGSGGAAFVLGGAVRGGRVFADWPGLAPAQRFEGRDLRITTDLRSVLRPILAEHLRVPMVALDRDVLPGSAGLPSLDLLRSGSV